MKVHAALGPGLFEKVYQVCLVHELKKEGMQVVSEVDVPVIYDNIKLETGFRLDLLVEDNIVIELKSVDRIAPIHKAQLLTYLKLMQLQVGLILNFNVPHLRNGIERVANTMASPLLEF